MKTIDDIECECGWKGSWIIAGHEHGRVGGKDYMSIYCPECWINLDEQYREHLVRKGWAKPRVGEAK